MSGSIDGFWILMVCPPSDQRTMRFRLSDNWQWSARKLGVATANRIRISWGRGSIALSCARNNSFGALVHNAIGCNMDGRITFFLALPEWDEREVSIFQGFPRVLLRFAWALQTLVRMPGDLLEFTTSRQTRLAR